MPAITTGIGRIGHSHSIHPGGLTGPPAPVRAPPDQQLIRRDLLGGLIHEYEHAA
jgi:hypothetical protein